MQRVTRERWQAASAAHAAEVDELTKATLERRQIGQRHPTEDFLWNYYSLRPSQLRKWHPGYGFALEDAESYRDQRGYLVDDEGLAYLSPAFIEKRRSAWEEILALLESTAAREPRFGCSALHEWAMVYRLEQQDIRHEQVPLRLSVEEVAKVVEAGPLNCSHYDAFRFYTPDAIPLNRWQLTRETQIDFEQSGCLHANMDLYKWGYKLLPAISSDLLLRCFYLARQARELDMAASPYDASAYGVIPIEIETTGGRLEFARRQQEIALASAPLREELIAAIRLILTDSSNV